MRRGGCRTLTQSAGCPRPTEDDSTSEPTRTRRCPWCDATATGDAVTCAACGAALAQRSDLGIAIPGVTAVDPALKAFDEQTPHLRGNSPSQSMAGGAIAAAALGGPVAALAVGGLVAVAAAEYLAASSDGPAAPDLATLGRPSESALQAAAKLDAMDQARGADPGNGEASNTAG